MMHAMPAGNMRQKSRPVTSIDPTLSASLNLETSNLVNPVGSAPIGDGKMVVMASKGANWLKMWCLDRNGSLVRELDEITLSFTGSEPSSSGYGGVAVSPEGAEYIVTVHLGANDDELVLHSVSESSGTLTEDDTHTFTAAVGSVIRACDICWVHEGRSNAHFMVVYTYEVLGTYRVALQCFRVRRTTGAISNRGSIEDLGVRGANFAPDEFLQCGISNVNTETQEGRFCITAAGGYFQRGYYDNGANTITMETSTTFAPSTEGPSRLIKRANIALAAVASANYGYTRRSSRTVAVISGDTKTLGSTDDLTVEFVDENGAIGAEDVITSDLYGHPNVVIGDAAYGLDTQGEPIMLFCYRMDSDDDLGVATALFFQNGGTWDAPYENVSIATVTEIVNNGEAIINCKIEWIEEGYGIVVYRRSSDGDLMARLVTLTENF